MNNIDKSVFNRDLSLFIGAGASIQPPSNLPSFYKLRDVILNGLISQTDLNNINLTELSASHTKPELILQIIWDYCHDEINVIKGFEKTPPNVNHFSIASSCLLGVRLIITTNFDDCIEEALKYFNIPYILFNSTPTNNLEVEKFIKLIESGPDVILWKPHGDCADPKTLCFTIEKVAKLSVSKHLKTIFENILSHYNLLMLGYSGYDDDFFPLLFNYPYKTNNINILYWNSYSQPKDNSPPFEISKSWGKKFKLLVGDMNKYLPKINIPKHVDNENDNQQRFWANETNKEINKIAYEDVVSIIAQYYFRLGYINDASIIWKHALKDENISEIAKLRFKLNTTENDIKTIEQIFNRSLSFRELDMANIALGKLVGQSITNGNFKLAKKYLKKFKVLCHKNPNYFHNYQYKNLFSEYLKNKYPRIKRVNDLIKNIKYEIHQDALNLGHIIESITFLSQYIAQIAEEDNIQQSDLNQVVKSAKTLEPYNNPRDLAELYYSIAIAAIRLNDHETSKIYINLSEENVRACFANGIYSKDKYKELLAGVLHHKSMLGTAKESVKICEDCIKLVESIKNKELIYPNFHYYVGLFNSSIASNKLALQELDEAVIFCEIALHNHRIANDYRGEARTLITLVDAYHRLGKNEKAKKALLNAKSKHEKAGHNTKRLDVLIDKIDL